MKNKLLLTLIILIFTHTAVAQRNSVYFKNEIFSGLYSELYQQPLTITYNVLCYAGQYSRKGLDFYINDSIKTSDDNDYLNNVYDKGHLAPAASFNCNEKNLYLTFSYLNCVLQHEKLNRGVWRYLEIYERNLSKGAEVKVVINVIFSDEPKKVAGGASIPEAFIKKIYLNGELYESYYFKNEAPQLGKDFKYYKINSF